MSLTAQGKQMVGRSRCDSPAPRCAAASPATEKQSHGIYNNTETSATPLSSLASLLAFALLSGYAALHADSEELLGNFLDPGSWNTSTWAALVIFLTVGAVVMHFDFIDAVKEEAEKLGLQSMEVSLIITTSRYWLVLGSGVALVLGLTVGWCNSADPLFMEELHLHATNLKEALLQAIAMPLERTVLDKLTALQHCELPSELLGDTRTWTALVIFLMFGTVVMRSDFIDAVKEEAETEGLPSMGDSSLIPGGRYWLILGGGTALFLALSGAWWQGSLQYGLVAPLFMEELHSQATNLKDALFVAILGDGPTFLDLLLLGDAPTWTALVVFLMLGAVIMRFDFVEALQEEAAKEGLQSMDKFSPASAGHRWLVLGCGAALALAGAHHFQISGQLSEEVGIACLCVLLVFGLASTIRNSPKSKIAKAFTAN